MKEKEKNLGGSYCSLCTMPITESDLRNTLVERHRVHHHFRDDKTRTQPSKGKGGTLSCPLSKQVGAAVFIVSLVSSTC